MKRRGQNARGLQREKRSVKRARRKTRPVIYYRVEILQFHPLIQWKRSNRQRDERLRLATLATR